MRGWIVGMVVLMGCGQAAQEAPAAEPIRVAAAADLSAAFAVLGPMFERETGKRVTFSFAASGALSRQIREGAPFDVFAAANEAFVDDAVRAGVCLGATKRLYARGHLVAWWRGASTVAAPATLAELASPRFRRIAIANPETAPYGAAAKQALESAGIWDDVRERLVYGENVRQTLTFAETGNAEVALVARSVAIAARDGRSLDVDTRSHRPLLQALVVCRRGRDVNGGRAFADFVTSERARVVMRRFGFDDPAEASAQTTPALTGSPAPAAHP